MLPLNCSTDAFTHLPKTSSVHKDGSKPLTGSAKALSWNRKSVETQKVVSHQRHSDLRTLKIGTIKMTFTLEQGHLVYGFSG